MIEINNEDWTKKELEDQLQEVKQRLEILDMIDGRLFEMKKLAQRVIDEELSEMEIEEINNQVKALGQEVILLDKDSTQLS